MRSVRVDTAVYSWGTDTARHEICPWNCSLGLNMWDCSRFAYPINDSRMNRVFSERNAKRMRRMPWMPWHTLQMYGFILNVSLSSRGHANSCSGYGWKRGEQYSQKETSFQFSNPGHVQGTSHIRSFPLFEKRAPKTVECST